MRNKTKIEAEFYRLRGSVKVHSIKAKHIIINGFAEVLDTIRADKMLVIGGLKVRRIVADIVVLDITTPSIILDLNARLVRIHTREHGRIYLSSIVANTVYLKHVHVGVLKSKIIVINEGCIIDKLALNTEEVVLRINTPYCSFRTNPFEHRDKRYKIKVVFAY